MSKPGYQGSRASSPYPCQPQVCALVPTPGEGSREEKGGVRGLVQKVKEAGVSYLPHTEGALSALRGSTSLALPATDLVLLPSSG